MQSVMNQRALSENGCHGRTLSGAPDPSCFGVQGVVGMTLVMGDPRIFETSWSAAEDWLNDMQGLVWERVAMPGGVAGVWRRRGSGGSMHRSADGAVWFVVGSMDSSSGWADVLHASTYGKEVPLEGRWVLVRVDHDKRTVEIVTDWCGSIPVYHVTQNGTDLWTTHEPSAAAVSAKSKFRLGGAVELLMHGYQLGNGTLYHDVDVLESDSRYYYAERRLTKVEKLHSVVASDARWTSGWDDLVDECHDKTVRAISPVLATRSSWTLPLSGGLDSRVLACVACDQRMDVHALTYGLPRADDMVYGRMLAKKLRLDWESVAVDAEYLAKYSVLLLKWFGGSMLAHGMYQMPFLTRVRECAPIISGFLGDPLAGHHTVRLCNGPGGPAGRFQEFECAPSVCAVQQFFNDPITALWSDACATLAGEYAGGEGADFQRMLVLDIRNRQRRCISYHPGMYDAGPGVHTPFSNREYASFWFSLPRSVLDGRRLQMDMIRRFWPGAATVESTAMGQPLVHTGWSEIVRRLQWRLPRAWVEKLRWVDRNWVERMQRRALLASGLDGLPPFDREPEIPPFLNRSNVLECVRKAASGDVSAYEWAARLQAIVWAWTRLR